MFADTVYNVNWILEDKFESVSLRRDLTITPISRRRLTYSRDDRSREIHRAGKTPLFHRRVDGLLIAQYFYPFREILTGDVVFALQVAEKFLRSQFSPLVVLEL